MHIGKRIRKLRKEKKLTQEDLAKILGVKPTAVSAWESGRNKPLMDKVGLMAQYFDVPISHFFEEDKLEEKTIPIKRFAKLPIVGAISCGNGVIAYEDIEGYEGVIYFLDKTSDVLEILDTTAFAVVFLFVNFLNKTNVFEKILHGFCTAIFLKNNTLHLGHSGVIPGMSFFVVLIL